ncbi:MAG: hypothetical protein KME10_23480 [Plectolyngbya sp. WJT66-NPBG17]|jgi:hypothetical protein|nr:hypothetical protein [Plectolyngbya sp. WJT66-NPBG17]
MEPTTNNRTVQVEFTLSEEGRLTYRGCSDPSIIYELSCRAAEQARAYQRSQTRQDPLAIALTGIASACLIVLIWGIFTRPAPEYTPRYSEYAPTYRTR